MTIPDILPEYNEMTDSNKMNILGIAVTDLRNKSNIYEKILITGNPPNELPLPETVRNHENYIRDVKYWGRFVGGALVLQTIAFGAAVVIAVVKFLPLLEKLAQTH